MNIHIFGDSHAHNYVNILNAKVNWLGPVTMHRIGRDGLDILDLRKHEIQDGDIAIFIFGEIDVRAHIGKIRDERNKPLKDIIYELVQAYFNTLSINKSFFRDVAFIVRFVTPPSDKGYNASFPFYGTLVDRAEITKMLNSELEQNCTNYSFYYLDGYNDFSDESGCILPFYGDDSVHLNAEASSLLTNHLLSLITEIQQKNLF